jgi:hypothetical protein
MDNDSPKQSGHADNTVDVGIDQHLDQAPAEESLSEALNGLEQILEQRRRGGGEAGQRAEDLPQAAPADAQYTIPLLHDVVVPGDEPPGSAAGHDDMQALDPGIDEEEVCRKLSERLANEIEVIVQARVETAVQEAAEDIREQVRNHLEIMLPEIIEELNALGRRQGS